MHQRRINHRFTVRVVIAGRVAANLRAFDVFAPREQGQILHRIKDAALRGLETVAHVGQRARDDHGHRVVEERILDFVGDVDLGDFFAGGKEVPLTDATHNLKLNEVDLARPNKPEMKGPKTAHEEMVMMRKLYHEMVLKQQDIKTEDNGDKPVQIQGLSRKKDLAVASV